MQEAIKYAKTLCPVFDYKLIVQGLKLFDEKTLDDYL